MLHKVSIVIPAYNAEKYLNDAIQSALHQTYKPVEVIVVNDGSTDKTKEIAETFNKVIIIDKQNGGTASALNAGIRVATGNWIHWLSADDELYYNAIENVLKHISENYTDYFANRTIFYTNYDIIDEKGKIISQFIEPDRNNNTREQTKQELLKYFFGNGSSSMIHKSVFKEVGYFDESLPYFEDYEFWLRCVMLYKIQLRGIPIKTLKYRSHDGQISRNVDLTWNAVIKTRILQQYEAKYLAKH